MQTPPTLSLYDPAQLAGPQSLKSSGDAMKMNPFETEHLLSLRANTHKTLAEAALEEQKAIQMYLSNVMLVESISDPDLRRVAKKSVKAPDVGRIATK